MLAVIAAVVLVLFPGPIHADTVKNVILMISDGQGFNTVRATEYYTGSKAVYEGSDFKKYGMQTYSAGTRGGYIGRPYNPASMAADFHYARIGATDSASSATAMFTGVKNYDREINWSTGGEPLTTFFERAARQGKSIGVVSSVYFTQATPASVYGHNKARGNLGELAGEAVYGSNPVANNGFHDAGNYYGNLKVVMGPGNPLYDNNGALRGNPDYGNVGSSRNWTDLNAGVNGWSLVTATAHLKNLVAGATPDKVFVVPRVYDTLQVNRSPGRPANSKTAPYADAQTPDLPTLVDMTRAALNVLDNNTKGFVVMIEGGAVDWASHSNLAGRMIEEQIDFNNSVQAVADYLDASTSGNNWNNTLLIVTADHEAGHLWGDGSSGSSFVDVNRNGVFDAGVDYAHLKDNGAGVLPGVRYYSGRHTNALVPLYARGAKSDLFAGCVIGMDTTLKELYNLDSSWSGRYVDNTSVFKVMNASMVEPDVCACLPGSESRPSYPRP